MSFWSYAQNFEDVILWRALKHIDKGFYIDVGANDPQHDSVTKAFYEAGWCGINIEPSAQWFERLENERLRDINLQLAAGSQDGEIVLYEFPDTGLSTVDPEVARKHEKESHYTKRTVQVRTLNSICQTYDVEQIHFLKIDVEGAEAHVLGGLDLSTFRPWIVVIESIWPGTHADTSSEWSPMLEGNGYEFAYFDGINRFYVANEHQELKVVLAVPPNCFDEFTLDGSQSFVDTEPDFQELSRKLRLSERLKDYLAIELSGRVEAVNRSQEEIAHLRARATWLKNEWDYAESRIARFDWQIQHWMAEAGNANQQLQELKSSPLWKKAEMLQKLTQISQDMMRSTVRLPKRLKDWMIYMLRRFVRRSLILVSYPVRRNPRLRAWVIARLARYPRLYRKLRQVVRRGTFAPANTRRSWDHLFPGSKAPGAMAQNQELDSLTSGARQIYRKIQFALARKKEESS